MGLECGLAASSGMKRDMDRIDRKILSLYQEDTRRIAESIGKSVGLSAAAVQRRLKRLRETGVIRAEVAVLDGAKLGVPITCIVTLAVKAPPSELDKFKRQLRALPDVQQCYHVTGSSDLILMVTAASMEDYGRFAREHLELSRQVARYETHVVLDRVKVGLSLPIGA
jgi:Lrp/AsnC family transcriptional regulator, leucine-responsive regulatory protein